jgi:hypothetical protein
MSQENDHNVVQLSGLKRDERGLGQRLTQTPCGCLVGVLISVAKRNFGPKGKEKVLEFMDEVQEKKTKRQVKQQL